MIKAFEVVLTVRQFLLPHASSSALTDGMNVQDAYTATPPWRFDSGVTEHEFKIGPLVYFHPKGAVRPQLDGYQDRTGSETRKLAAILAADVVGFSGLAGSDEERTLARLRALRSDLIDPTIAVHRGRVMKRDAART